MKITFMGAGSTVFARNVIGDCLCSDILKDSEFALYDIDETRLEESYQILTHMRVGKHSATFTKYLGAENRKEALRGASFVINAIQVGGYDPCTITDFEIPKKYGFRQTIGDSYGIGGIMRALRTIPVLEEFARDIEEVCPDAWFLNYSNPMAMLTGYLQTYTKVKTIGICHSVQVCSEKLMKNLGMEDKLDGRVEKIAGINHMAWLLEIKDKDGKDLYPEIRERALNRLNHPEEETQKLADLVRLEYIRTFGYYCTESSEHNAEYNSYFIKKNYPELIEKYRIPMDEYLKRCVKQIEGWKKEYEDLKNINSLEHTRSREYASYIMESLVTGVPLKIGGNVLNKNRYITNLPEKMCVEVPCIVDQNGITPQFVGELPTQLAGLDSLHSTVVLLTQEAAHEKSREKVYQAALMDPRVSGELDIETTKKMVDELLEAHKGWIPEYHK